MTTNPKTLTLDDEEQFSFRFKRLPAYKTIDSSSCSCCLLNFKREYPEQTKQEGLQAMVCYGCLQITHRYCYGLNTSVKEEDDVNYLLCDSCWEGSKQHPSCDICKNSGGLLKSLADGGFIHPLCGFTHPEVNVLNYQNLEFKKAPFYADSLSVCEICDKENAYMKCSQQNCGKRVHPFCVVKKFKQKQEKSDEEEVKDCWKFFMSAGESKLYGDLSQEKEINDFVSQNKDNTINTERGGFQYVLCPDHSQHVFYCNCGMEIEDQMVFCDCCLEWYHASCTHFKDDGSESFICPFCISWFQLKQKILKQIQSDKLESYQLKLTKNPKLYVPDFILLALICDKRLTKATQAGTNTTKITKTIQLYPLKLSSGSSQQKKIESADVTSFDEIDAWIFKNKQEKQVDVFEIRHIEDIWQNFDSQIKNTQKYIKTRINYLTTWTNLLRTSKITISYLKVRGLLYQYYDILRKYMMQSPTIIKTLKQPITFIQELLEKLNPFIQKLNKLTSTKQIQDVQDDDKGPIDLSEIIAEAKIIFSSRKILMLDVKIRKPYVDLNRFYQDFRRVSQSLLQDRIVFKQQRRQQSKRVLPTFEKLSEKTTFDAKRKILKNETSSTFSNDKKGDKSISNIVTEEDRVSIQKILINRMVQNTQFNGVKSDDFVRIIENQVFGQYHKDRNRYLQLSENFQMMFMTLEECPLISAKAKKKNFQYTFMKDLVENTARIKSLEEKLRLKNKQQAVEKKSQAPVHIAPVIDTKNDILNSIFSGKIQKKLEKQLEGIYAIQRQAQRERRNKNYYRHDDRDRDRDRDRRDRDRDRDRYRDSDRDRDRKDKYGSNNKKDSKNKRKGSDNSDNDVPAAAKFSDQDQDDNYQGYNPLAGPKDVEKQKQKQRQRQRDYLQQVLETRNKISNQPFLYNPEQDDKPVIQKQKQIEKGTILKLKTCQIEMYLNKQKKNFEGSLLSLEDVKTIKQLCDPNFDKLSIKKDKPQGQILEYLSKTSRKKYRFLIGWVEAEKTDENQFLRNLAIDCEKKQRVYGLQNDLAKIHIMSSKQLNKQMVNKFRAPSKVTTEDVAEYLNEHRIVFVLQYSIEKLYQVKSSSSQFSITPILTSAQVISEPVYMTNIMQPPIIPYEMNMMPIPPVMMVNPQSNMEYRNQVYIDTWDPEPMPQMPIKMRKEFSPITSEDEGPSENKQKKSVQTSNSGFDIMQILGKLDESGITKLTQQPTVHQQQQQPPPPPPQQQMYPPPIPQQPQRVSQPSSYLYQQHRMPMMNNPNMMVMFQIIQRHPQPGMPQQYGQGYNSQQNQMQMRGIPNPIMMSQQRYMTPPSGQPGYYSSHMPPPPGQYPPPQN